MGDNTDLQESIHGNSRFTLCFIAVEKYQSYKFLGELKMNYPRKKPKHPMTVLSQEAVDSALQLAVDDFE